MGDLILKYELDLTGKRPSNRVLNEEHTLAPGINRSAVMRYGAYYTGDMIVRDSETGDVLDKGSQYKAVMYWSDPSERSGLEVCTALVVTDPQVSDTINVDVNYVGGLYQNVTPVIIEAIEDLNLDDRPIMWGDLLGRPDAFPPASHLHDLGDIYGFEYVVEQLSFIREAILYGDVASHEELKRLIEDRYDDAVNLIDALDNRLSNRIDDHLEDVNNPHETTKSQVGLGDVENYPIASENQAVTGERNDRYMTPLRVAQAIQIQAGVLIQEHIDDKDNPHETTKSQVGLGNVENYPIASENQARQGEINNRYMTPLRVAQAIETQAGALLQAHVNNTSNPHSVTKSQVGLGNVDNYNTANNTQTISGNSSSLFVTPAGLRAAFDDWLPASATRGEISVTNLSSTSSSTQGFITGRRFQEVMRDYTNAFNNAGNYANLRAQSTTKADVGLGNVPNWAGATEAQAIAGTSGSAIMTPLRTAQAIDARMAGSGEWEVFASRGHGIASSSWAQPWNQINGYEYKLIISDGPGRVTTSGSFFVSNDIAPGGGARYDSQLNRRDDCYYNRANQDFYSTHGRIVAILRRPAGYLPTITMGGGSGGAGGGGDPEPPINQN